MWPGPITPWPSAPRCCPNRLEPLYAVAFSPDGGLLAAAGAAEDRDALGHAGARPSRRAPVPLTGPANTVYSLAFSARGSLLAAGSADDTVRLWDVSDPLAPACRWASR